MINRRRRRRRDFIDTRRENSKFLLENEVSICSTQGCTNQEVNVGICKSHGARCKKKEDDEFISYMMKERNKSDWTDEEKVRINKITKQRMINRRRRRRRDFIDTRRENSKLLLENGVSICSNQEVNGGICKSHGARCKKKEDDEFISYMMKIKNKSDWTDQERFV